MKKIFSFFTALLLAGTMMATQKDEVESMTVFMVNTMDWTDVYAYVWNSETYYSQWPGNPMKLTETVFYDKQVYSFTFPSNYNMIIFNNGKGGTGNQTSDMKLSAATPYYYEGIWYASMEEINPEAEAKFYISGNYNLVGMGSLWDPMAIKSLEDSYTLHLAPGAYELKISLDGTTDTWKGFSDLTSTVYGLTGWEDNNAIAFTLAEEGDVVVTYRVVDEVVTFTVTGTFFTIESGYYLLGTHGFSLLELKEADKFALNGGVEGEWVINATLSEGNYIIVALVDHNAFSIFYGDNYYIVDAAHAGEKTIYFRPTGNELWAEFGGYIYIDANDTHGFQEIEASQKAVKVLRDGQLFIIKNDIHYNAQGTRL